MTRLLLLLALAVVFTLPGIALTGSGARRHRRPALQESRSSPRSSARTTCSGA